MLPSASMQPYPVQLEVSSPPRFERIQLLIRLMIAIGLGWLGVTFDWLWSVLFFALPLIAAGFISARGADFYLEKTTPRLWSALTWLFAFTAYMLFITDRVPLNDEHSVRAELQTTGRPSTGRSLARLVTSIPSALVLCLVCVVSALLCFVAFLSILFAGKVPTSIVEFQTGYLRWQARLVAYHASLVEEYPPFSFGDRAPKLPTAMVHS